MGVTNPAEPSTARGEETRQRIVDVALRLFEEKGYAKTTMRAVASLQTRSPAPMPFLKTICKN